VRDGPHTVLERCPQRSHLDTGPDDYELDRGRGQRHEMGVEGVLVRGRGLILNHTTVRITVNTR